ncbi:MAG: SagB/ThcOx family dehydrogenase [Anaerolineales bacterium]|jgi:SagB-type dehydrogenase family enzyme
MTFEKLPEINKASALNNILIRRRSVRAYMPDALGDQVVSRMLWACQGITRGTHRTAPSAGGLYPLEIYWLDDLKLAHYEPKTHQLRILTHGDLRARVARSALDQDFIAKAPATLIITAVYERVTQKYGEPRGIRYVDMEAGHAAQNVLLQATAEGLASVPVGAFHDRDISAVLGLPEEHIPLYLLPIGYASS